MNRFIFALLALIAIFVFTPSLSAQVTTNSTNYTVSQVIPDHELTGISDSRIFSSEINFATNVSIMLEIAGGFNGDLYGYVAYDTNICILFNGTGRTADNSFGYSDSGFNITFDEFALNGDIHNYRDVLNPNGGVLTGIWQPDGRDIHPDFSVDTTLRSATLNSFYGVNPNGRWTIFLADTSPLFEATLLNWGIIVTGVPEPSTWGLMLGGLLLFVAQRFRAK